MDSRSFEDLEVYGLAAALADEVRSAVKQWHRDDLWASGIQMMRATDSIGASIAEAFGRGTRRDQLRFLFIARGSAYELQHWMAIARRRRLPIPENAWHRAIRVGRMMNGLIRSLAESSNART